MIYKNSYIRIILLSLLLGASCFLFFWSVQQQHLKIAPYTFLAIFILVLITIIQSSIRISEKHLRLPELIGSKEFMERFAKDQGSDSSQTYNAFIELLSDLNLEKEKEHFYSSQILDIIGTAILSYDHHGKIDIVNRAALSLLKCQKPYHIDQLSSEYPSLVKTLREIQPGEQILKRITVKGEVLRISIQCSLFKLSTREIKLISFQNILMELQNEELEAWQKLISVLRHEIMNSVAPIKSLTSTVLRILSEDGHIKTINKLSNDSLEKVYNSLQAIDKRNQGMIKFIESYRSITNIPRPVFEEVDIKQLFENVRILMSSSLQKNKVMLSTEIDPTDIRIQADEKQISQVLINLINNAMEAPENKKDGLILLKAKKNKDQSVNIEVSDNGSGIPDEIFKKIFVPFFSTKEKGSGIGLSLSREILRNHHASIRVYSQEEGTKFAMEF